MKRLASVLIVCSLLLALGLGAPRSVSASSRSSTPTPTPTSSSKSTPTATATPKTTPTPTATAKATATPTPSPTPTTSSGPAAPTSLSPANGASVTVPFTISWSAVSDPNGIVGYNWAVSPSSSMSPVIQLGSTNGATQDTVSGLANGTYYWHVQAVAGPESNEVQGNWSQTQSFTVTGASSGEPGSPTLGSIQGGTSFHPMEVLYFSWSAVSGADNYHIEASTDPSFPIANTIDLVESASPSPTGSLQLGDSEPQGTWYLRIAAGVDATGIRGVPSNVDTFTLSFNAPLPPPPTLLSPANGATVTLPITFKWTDVPNPQPMGYTIEIADDSGFKNIELLYNQITGPQTTITSLTAGTKYWRVNSEQGDSSPDTGAYTAWSATGTFVVPSTPPKMGSLAVSYDPAYPADSQTVTIQLTGPAPSGGAVISLSSTNATAAPVPATFTMPAGVAIAQFRYTEGQVSASTPVTLTGSLNGSSASVTYTASPSTLQSLYVFNPTTGGQTASLQVMLTGPAPSGGDVVSLSSSSPLASPPATATVAAGDYSVNVNVPTQAVTSQTTITLSASFNGTTVQTAMILDPQVAPASITISPNPASDQDQPAGVVTVASAHNYDVTLSLTNSNPSAASIGKSVTIPAGSTTGGFNVTVPFTTTQQTTTISVSGAGVTKSVTLTVVPPPA